MRGRVPLITGAAVVVLAVVVLSTGILSPLFSRGGNEEIYVVMKTTGPHMEFWQIVRSGIEEASQEFGVTPEVVGPEFEREIDLQIEIFEEVINSEPDGILLVASDFTRLVALTEEATRRGITVVTLDSALDSELPASFVATDNVAAGRTAGEEIGRLVPPDGKIAIISHIRGVATAIDRENGVVEALADRDPNLVLGPFYSRNDTELGFQIVENLYADHPDLVGIVALNENSTVGAGRAIRDLGLVDDIALVGFDNSREEIEMLENGVVRALVVQRPFNMGYVGIQTLVRSMRGDDVDPFINTGSVLVRKEDMFTEENQKLLFPIIRGN